MAKDCWCNLKFHLPGEKEKHQKSLQKSKELSRAAEEAKNRGRSNKR